MAPEADLRRSHADMNGDGTIVTGDLTVVMGWPAPLRVGQQGADYLSNRVIGGIVGTCRAAWMTLMNQPDKITSVAIQEWANGVVVRCRWKFEAPWPRCEAVVLKTGTCYGKGTFRGGKRQHGRQAGQGGRQI